MSDEVLVPQSPTVEPTPAANDRRGAASSPAPIEPLPPAGPLSAPYRAGLVEIPAPVATPRHRPVLGLSLWVFGVAMWAFVVMGQLTTSIGPDKRDFLVSEGLAAFLVFAVTAGAWGVALRASLVSTPAQTTRRAVLRGVGAAFLAFVLWSFMTLFAAAYGNSSSDSSDGKITVALALVAALAAFVGRRIGALARVDPTPRERAVSRAIWVAGALITIVALAELIAGE